MRLRKQLVDSSELHAQKSEAIRLKKQMIDSSELHAQKSEAIRLKKQMIDSSEMHAQESEVMRLKKQMIVSSERHEVSKAMLERVREENIEEPISWAVFGNDGALIKGSSDESMWALLWGSFGRFVGALSMGSASKVKREDL
jgi:hypothetical protein